MDDPALPAAELDDALDGLRRLNRASRAERGTRHALRRIAADHGRTALHVLDVATGGGDVPLALLDRPGPLDLTIDACDRNPLAIERLAPRLTTRRGGGRAFVHDLADGPPPGAWDVVMCSLFLHHVPESEVVAVLRRLRAAARLAVVVNDLDRSRTGLILAHLATRVLSRSPIVHADGPQSVRAAMTLPEFFTHARTAGARRVDGWRRFPARWIGVLDGAATT